MPWMMSSFASPKFLAHFQMLSEFYSFLQLIRFALVVILLAVITASLSLEVFAETVCG